MPDSQTNLDGLYRAVETESRYFMGRRPEIAVFEEQCQSSVYEVTLNIIPVHQILRLYIDYDFESCNGIRYPREYMSAITLKSTFDGMVIGFSSVSRAHQTRQDVDYPISGSPYVYLGTKIDKDNNLVSDNPSKILEVMRTIVFQNNCVA